MSTTTPRPTSIRLFLADGTPDGIRIVEKSNWTGVAVVASRTQLAAALERAELARPGVYVLTGPGTSGEPRVYIGEADVLRERLKSHANKKDFWTQFVAFASTNEGLNKAHVRYLESRLIELAMAAKQWEVENGTAPAKPPLSEADRADAEWFLTEMLVIYPILGIDAFEAAAGGPAPKPQDELLLSERGAEARGQEVAEGFVVFAGARARATEVPTIHAYMHDLRERLIERKILVPDGDHLVFSQDYRFSSPSTASGVLVGGTSNGRRAWKNKAGETLKTIQDRQAEGPE